MHRFCVVSELPDSYCFSPNTNVTADNITKQYASEPECFNMLQSTAGEYGKFCKETFAQVHSHCSDLIARQAESYGPYPDKD